MSSFLKKSVWLRAAATCLVAGAAGVLWVGAARRPAPSLLVVSPPALAADGISTARIVVRNASGRALSRDEVSVRVVSGANSAHVLSVREQADGVSALVQAGIMPGTVELEATGPGILPSRTQFTTRLAPADRAGDGTPDFLRLDSPADRDAFRRWFTFLAESQAFVTGKSLPREITDCAALARFAYREALRRHDAAWAAAQHLPALPDVPAIEKYSYPFTPLGAALFRVRPGGFSAGDLKNGAFAEFADAKTLSSLNAHLVTRTPARALPGDLLFYLPEGHGRTAEGAGDDSYHTMIFIGSSRIDLAPGGEAWIVYHTGPVRGGPGEIRRVTLEDLLRHPEPRWRPVESNPYFLGVYRWNILRGAN